ncbi:hypothetical protein IFM89_007582, partial [Coptis chinensis]
MLSLKDSHEEDADVSPTVDTDSAVAENEVAQEEDSATDSETDLADNALEIPDDQFSNIESMELLLPDWHQNMVEFLRTGELPLDGALSTKSKRDAWRVVLLPTSGALIMTRSYAARAFKPGDWVLRQGKGALNPTNDLNFGELGGPFIIERLASKGSYFLKNLAGDVLTKPWSSVPFGAYFT